MRWINLLFVLMVNAVPLYGVKYLGWSVGTLLLLYWLENLLTGVFTAACIALHRKLTRKCGHWRPGVLGGKVDGKPNTAILLNDYIGFAIFFTLAQGLFVGAIVFVLSKNFAQLQFAADQFWQGASQIFAVLSGNFVVDAFQLHSRSFAWIKGYAQRRMGRAVVMHMTIILGIMGMAASQLPIAIVYVLIALKTISDLAPQQAQEPPAWLLNVAEKIRRAQGTDASWKRECDLAQNYASEDEKIMPAQA